LTLAAIEKRSFKPRGSDGRTLEFVRCFSELQAFKCVSPSSPRRHAFLVRPHKSRILRHIGGEDCGEAPRPGTDNFASDPRKPGSHQTRRRRKGDSNCRSLSRGFAVIFGEEKGPQAISVVSKDFAF
jgi:hypothetical protein